MSDPGRYGLVFINWNSADLVLAAVASIRAAAADPGQFQTIVVDNGSADDSVVVLRRELPDADVVALPENAGFARAVNTGLARVRGRYAFILNADIEFRNDATALLVAALAADGKAALACPKLLRPDGSLQAAAVPEPRLFWELVNRSLPRRFLGIRHDATVAVPAIVGPCMAVDLQRLAAVGLLDERFFFFFEETDWCRRIRAQGLRVLYVPAAEVVHLQGESANRRPVRARVQFYSSRYRYFRKHAGIPAVVVLFAGLWLRLSLDVLLHSVLVLVTGGGRRHRDRVAVYAALWLWHLLGCRPQWGFEGRRRKGRDQ